MCIGPRRQQVLDLVVEGLSNKEIAARLSMSIHVVKHHVGWLFLEYGVRNRTELAVLVTRERNDKRS